MDSTKPESNRPASRPSDGTDRRWAPWRRRVTAIDLDGDKLRVVQAVRQGGRVRFTRYAATDLRFPGANDGEPTSGARGEAIRGALRELEVRSRSVVIGLPRAQVMLRTLDLPSATGPGEVASMVHFQVARDLPFPAEEAVIDFMVLPESSRLGAPEGAGGGAGRTRVLAAVVRRELLAEYQDLARAAGVKLAGLGLRSLANARCLDLCRLAPEDRCVAMISLRAEEVIFDVLLDRTLVFSRVGPVRRPGAGSDEGDPGEGTSGEYLDAVVLEAVRGLHNYEGLEGHGRVTRFIVAGSTGAEAAVTAALQERFGIAGTRLDLAEVTGLQRLEGNGATGAQAAFGLAHGALDPGGLPFDFLRPKRPPAPRDPGRLRTLGAIAGAAFLLLAVVVVRARLVNNRQADRAALQEQLNLAERNAKSYRLARGQATTVRTWEGEGRGWLDHLAFLSSLLPPSPELYVTSISTGSKNTLNLAVKVRSGEILNRLDGALRAAGYAVRPSAITPANDRHGYRFQANLELEAPAGMEVDLRALQVPDRPADDASLTQSAPSGALPAVPVAAAAPTDVAVSRPDAGESAAPEPPPEKPPETAPAPARVAERSAEEDNTREARARRREEWAERMRNGERPPGVPSGRGGRPDDATRPRSGAGERPGGGVRPPGSRRTSGNE